MDTPIRSGRGRTKSLFDLCVRFLLWLADLLGVTYETINVWIFCVIWPIFTMFLIGVVVWQWLHIRKWCP
jgi:hypothetical protein